MSELVTVGDDVKVNWKELQQLHGIVRFVGEIEKQQGIYYGIELSTSKGNSNGNFNGSICYFKCKINRGVFVRRSAITYISNTNHHHTVHRIGIHELIGVKFKEEEEYKATVRYIGAPTGLKTNCIYYGIEFEEAIGETSGTYEGIRYFTTANHKQAALFIKANSKRIIYPFVKRKKVNRKYSYSDHTESTIDSDFDDETDSDEDRLLHLNEYIDYFTTRYEQNVHESDAKPVKITCKYYHPLNEWILNAQNADTFKKRYQCTRSLININTDINTGDATQAIQILNVFAEWLEIENHVVLRKHILQLLIPFANTLYPNPAAVWIESSSIATNITKSLITKQWTAAALPKPKQKKAKQKPGFASLVTNALIAIYVETESIQIKECIPWIMDTISSNNKQAQAECWQFLSLILELSMIRKSCIWIAKDLESLITDTNICAQMISMAKNTLLLNKNAPDVMLPCALFIYGMNQLYGGSNSELREIYERLLTDDNICIFFDSIRHTPYSKIFELCKDCEKYKMKIKELQSKQQKECNECYNLKDANEGYADKTDAIWYCVDCWNAFNETKSEEKYDKLQTECNALQKQIEEYEINKIKLNRTHNMIESQYNNKCKQYDELQHECNETKTKYDELLTKLTETKNASEKLTQKLTESQLMQKEQENKLHQLEVAKEEQKIKRIQRMTGDNHDGSRQFRDEMKVLKKKNKRRMSQMQDIYEVEYEKLLKEYQEYKLRYPPDENDPMYGQIRNETATLVIE